MHSLILSFMFLFVIVLMCALMLHPRLVLTLRQVDGVKHLSVSVIQVHLLLENDSNELLLPRFYLEGALAVYESIREMLAEVANARLAMERSHIDDFSPTSWYTKDATMSRFQQLQSSRSPSQQFFPYDLGDDDESHGYQQPTTKPLTGSHHLLPATTTHVQGHSVFAPRTIASVPRSHPHSRSYSRTRPQTHLNLQPQPEPQSHQYTERQLHVQSHSNAYSQQLSRPHPRIHSQQQRNFVAPPYHGNRYSTYPVRVQQQHRRQVFGRASEQALFLSASPTLHPHRQSQEYLGQVRSSYSLPTRSGAAHSSSMVRYLVQIKESMANSIMSISRSSKEC
eukprot:m.276794 g.276794  ORF g.276794 m.276794 type:complete len:338 (-) comp15714_c2_seq1:964-1977(-)